MKITRREGIIIALSMAATGCGGGQTAGSTPPPVALTPPPAPPSQPSPPAATAGKLKNAAAAKGMRIGSAFNAAGPASGSYLNSNYAKLLEAECNILVPENELKWQSIRPNAADFEFTPFDNMLAYAESKNMAMRGHTLLWHQPQWTPDWLSNYDYGVTPATEAARLLTNHLETVIARYGTRIVSFDVVNEAINYDNNDVYSETSLSKAFGGTEVMMDFAFRKAQELLPNTQLVYNDFMGWEPDFEGHRASVLRLLTELKRRGTPIDALGIQSHLTTERTVAGSPPPRQESEWRKFLDEITAMGYGLLITEMDVNDQGFTGNIAARDQAVADYAKSYLDVTLSYSQIKDILFWGICDPYSWLQSFKPRTDGLENRCTLFDASFKNKPVYDAIVAAVAAAPARS
ncbi:endo-1,4-beta-xylanase [Sphingorhabdus arenilitoris]|uniref:Beta-xylanase n=1 Tax=Sphingorhabdus arenilitoris TaxID=1490041 RepID=A0ABV8REX3_9SPHN